MHIERSRNAHLQKLSFLTSLLRGGIWGVIFSLIIPFHSNAQFLKDYEMNAFQMRSIGPAGMSGRVTTIDVVEKNPEHIYIGTASGGVWESKSGGITWKPIFDQQATQSIGSLAICQQNPSIIWVGTGEGNPRNSQSSGAGVYKSIDGGKTWEFKGLKETKTIHRVIIDPTDENTVYLGVTGSAWGPNPERGVYKTTNGGETWEKILFVDDTTGCSDLIMDPSNPNKLIAAMWEYGRKPWTFNSGGDGSALYITYNGGKSWKKLSDKNGLPSGKIGRSGLALCHSKPHIVYALVESKPTTLYRSDDGGENWRKISDKNVGNRPFYYADIFVDPKNENRLFNLYSVVSKSEDGGKSFQILLPYSRIHPDHHAFYIHPSNPNYIIEGNDGGLNISRDGGDNWRFIENLPLAQFYHINVDNDVPYNIYGGMQDNGSWVGPSETWSWQGIKNFHWQEVLFGDGFDVMPKAGNSRYGYAMYQGGQLHAYDKLTGETQKIRPVTSDSIPLRFNWNAALAQDPHNPCGVYFGSQFLHYSNDCGLSWKILSPDLTTNDTSKQKQALSGGLTIDATQAENYTSITCVGPSPISSQVIWVGTDDGNVQITKSGGQAWENVIKTGKKMAPEGAWITQIIPSNFKQDEAFVVMNNYRQNDWKPYVFKLSKYGKNWEKLINEEDSLEFHAHSIVQDFEEENLLFLGMENGLYFSLNGGEDWQKWTNNFPSVATTDLKIQKRESDLVIATFGRAAYVLDNISPLREKARQLKTSEKTKFTVYKAAPRYLASYQRPAGPRFGGDSEYTGANDNMMLIPYYIHPEAMKKPEFSKKDKKEGKDTLKVNYDDVFFTVMSLKMDTVRNIKFNADSGYHYVRWALDANSVRFPRQSKSKNGNPRGGGYLVPGTYYIFMEYAGYKDSISVKVLPDPRVNIKPADYLKQKKLYDDYLEKVEKLTLAYDFLIEAKKTIKRVEAATDLMEEDKKKAILDSSKKTLQKIKNLQEIFHLPENFEGYDHVTLKLNDLIFDALSYIQASNGELQANGKRAVEIAEQKMKETLEKINHFINNEWAVYTKQLNAYYPKWYEKQKPITWK